jgi:hypothetical protein
MFLLIDTRIPPDPPPAPRRRRLPRPDPRVTCRLVAAVGLLGGGAGVSGIAGVLLVSGGVVAAASAATTALPYALGLTEHRQ